MLRESIITVSESLAFSTLHQEARLTTVLFSAKYWPEPYEFKPSRYLGDWDRDAFMPFSGMSSFRFL